jgi:hypothetical protein
LSLVLFEAFAGHGEETLEFQELGFHGLDLLLLRLRRGAGGRRRRGRRRRRRMLLLRWLCWWRGWRRGWRGRRRRGCSRPLV